MVEAVHLSGPVATIERLAQLAARIGMDHAVDDGVLRVSVVDASRLVAESFGALAPLEARLVRAVTIGADVSGPAVLAAAAAAPTLSNLIARSRHARLLEAIQSREGVAVGFQPCIDLPSGRPIGFEALLRVRIGKHDVAPSDVLAAAEEAGCLAEIDAIARSVALHQAGSALGDRLLFLNVLPSSLPVPAEQLEPFVDEVTGLGFRPDQVVLEMPVGPPGALRRQVDAVFQAARNAGFLIGLDNVRNERDLDAVDVRPDIVKLDRSLVRGLPSPNATRSLGAVVRACGFEASSLVAQGIEAPEQLSAVRDLGVQLAQGWHLGRPGMITP